jgi:hypothetical protein
MGSVQRHQVFPVYVREEEFHGLHRPQAPHQRPDRVSEPWTASQQRHLSYIAEYTSNLMHIAGVSNVVADALSRPPHGAGVAASKPGRVNLPTASRPASAAAGSLMAVVAASTSVDCSWLAKEQQDCAATQAAAISSSLTVCPFEVNSVPLLCDVSSDTVRPIVPQPCRQVAFRAIHSIAHPGVRAPGE